MSILSHTTQADSDTTSTKERVHEASADISHEFKSFVSDIERLVKETASLTGDDLARAKIKLNQRINLAKHTINNASSTLMDGARKTATATNDYVHDKPWPVIGAGALVGFLVGVLIGNNKH